MIYGEVKGEWTGYQPPKSAGFGHPARRRDPSAAWAMTTAFLHRWCVFQVDGASIRLKSRSPGLLTESSAAREGLGQARARFGDPASVGGDGHEWHLSNSEIDDGISLCADVNGRLPQRSGPLTINFVISLVWRTLLPAGNVERVDFDLREGGSSMGVGVWTRALFLQPSLVFPFPWDAPELSAFLSSLEELCPFRFRDTYFRRLLPNKHGDLTRARKLPKGWRETARRSRLP